MVFAQAPTVDSKLTFESDFRFRLEQDWDSQNQNNGFREDRLRMRYRARFGAKYQHNDWASVGVRLRTGEINKQQDPHLTLGDGPREFGTIPVGFETMYFNIKKNRNTAWIGKNAFPFSKNNELLWSNNVFPEGVYYKRDFLRAKDFGNEYALSLGHFIISTGNTSFEDDSYLQAFQLDMKFKNCGVELFPAFYSFKNIADIPDGNESFLMDYSILYLGTKIKISESKKLSLLLDYFVNLEDLDGINEINPDLREEKMAYSAGLAYGKLSEEGDWKVNLNYAYVEKYAAVDFLAQNYWARWDYGSQGSPDSRMTNFHGLELQVAYAIDPKTIVNIRFFRVEQIANEALTKETGSRVRLDLDIKL
jgi:hypothetical protein